MKQVVVRLGEIVCLVCLVAFIMFITSDEKISDKTAEEISAEVISVINAENMTEVDFKKTNKHFGIDKSQYTSVVYYFCEDVMDVRELFIAKAVDDSESQSILSAVEKKLSEKKALFESYAPEQSALLEKAVLVYEKGVVFYAVGEDAQTALSEFSNSL